MPLARISELSALLTRLAQHPHAPAFAALLEAGQAGAPIFARHHETPGHITVSAYILHPDGGQLALILHRKLGLWLQPGGHVEALDSSLEAGARREAEEETGLVDLQLLQAPFDLDVHGIPALGSTAAHQHFDLRFLYQAKNSELSHGDDVAACSWFALREVAEATGALAQGIPTDHSVRRLAQRLLLA